MNNMTDPRAAAATTAGAYITSGSVALFGHSLNDIALFIGIACAVTTAVVNWYYQRRQTHAIERRERGIEQMLNAAE